MNNIFYNSSAKNKIGSCKRESLKILTFHERLTKKNQIMWMLYIIIYTFILRTVLGLEA